MYLGILIATMFVLPIASTAIELAASGGPLMAVAGKWFVFWIVGVRLGLAGVSQIVRPGFTAKTIFEIADPAASKIVKELGFANVTFGVLGLASLFVPTWFAPAALAGLVFLGLDGVQHILNGERNRTETIAMVTDVYAAAIFAASLAWRLFYMH